MKKILITLTLIMAFTLPFQVMATAQLQVIHNSADPAAAVVDVYVNGSLAIPDFQFRTATSFLTLPSGVLLNIGIAPGNSVNILDTIKNFPITLNQGQVAVAIASGVLNPASFAANPDGRSTAFGLTIIPAAQTTSLIPGFVDLAVNHGSTDAPTVDVLARNVATLVDNASYGDVTSYISVGPNSYILDVTPGNNNNTIVASFTADLTTLAGGAGVVFASGFLNPAANQNGEAFGLFAALPTGTVIQLPQISVARLQIIHNAADPAAANVDIYVNGALTLSNFAFRTATPYIDIPAGVTLNIGVAPALSVDVNDTIVNFPVQFDNGKTYVAIANGVLTPASFAANPDGKPTGFTLFVKQDSREQALTGTDVDFFAVHGSSDAPTVDVIARNVATLVDNASYSDITGYVTVPPASYILDVTPGNNNSTIVASFTADLTTLGGQSAVVFASGFLDPTSNQNGPGFGLYAALANGTVVAFAPTSQARLQVIHNAADPSASVVDVYVNGTLTLNDFAFRTATPFIDIPADVTINIGVAPGNSTSANDTLVNFPLQFINGQTYVALANGVLNPASFAANPDGRSTAFTLFASSNIRESAINASEVDFIGVHGSSDAPTVDIKVNGGPILIDNAAYGDITSYLSVPAAAYTLDVTPGANNSVIVASYLADLSTLAGGSAVVFASGFLNPATNQNGPAFGLYAALVDGTVIPFQVVTGLNENENSLNVSLYPNLLSQNDVLTINNTESNMIDVEITNTTGQIVNQLQIPAGSQQTISNLNTLSKGMYFVNMRTNEKSNTQKFIIQ